MVSSFELDPPPRHQIQRGDAFGHPGGMVGRQLDDAVTQPDPRGALAGCAEKDLGRRAVGVLLQEVMLDFPRVVVAQLVGQLDLVEAVTEQPILVIVGPRPRQLVFVEDPESHGARSGSATEEIP